MFPQKDDPLFLLIDAMSDSNNPSGAIERSEARGQQLLVNSETLPHKFNSGTREQFEKMGIVFGEKADDIFSFVTLPQGWKKVATDHSMWSKLLDEQGRERASIFYKAAFYDRDAFLNISRRYSYSVQPVCGWEDENYRSAEWQCVVKDCESIIWKSEPIEPEPKFDKENSKPWNAWYDKKEKLSKIGISWLNENYPDWESPLAYWSAA